MAGVVACHRDEAVTVTALRRDGSSGWGEDDQRIIAVLLPHLSRARQTEERLQVLQAGEHALNTLRVGAVLVDAAGAVIYFNRAAEQALVLDRDGLAISNDRIAADDASSQTALKRLIADSVAPEGKLETAPDVIVRRPSLRRPYLVSASPLRRTPGPFIGTIRPAAVIVITDPERARSVPVETLRQGFGLTRAEAALAVSLGQGHTLQEAAERLAIRYETARTHLSRILNKTRTSRQAELMKLLAQLSR